MEALTHTDMVKIIFLSMASMSVLIGILEFLARKTFIHFLDRNLKKYGIELQATTQRETDRLIAEFQSKLDLNLEKSAHTHRHKVELYRSATEPLIDLVINYNLGNINEHNFIEFERQRLRAWTQLAVFAPQEVLDAYDQFIGYLFDCFEDKSTYDWATLRSHALVFLNLCRADIGIGGGNIKYNGSRE